MTDVSEKMAEAAANDPESQAYLERKAREAEQQQTKSVVGDTKRLKFTSVNGKQMKYTTRPSQRNQDTYELAIHLEPGFAVAIDALDDIPLKERTRELQRIQAEGRDLAKSEDLAAAYTRADELADEEKALYVEVIRSQCKGWTNLEPFDIEALLADLNVIGRTTLGDEIIGSSSTGRPGTVPLKN